MIVHGFRSYKLNTSVTTGNNVMLKKKKKYIPVKYYDCCGPNIT